jgi:hypothetical protein
MKGLVPPKHLMLCWPGCSGVPLAAPNPPRPRASPPGGVSGFFIFRLWETLVAGRMFLFWGGETARQKSAPVAVAVALLLVGTSLAMAKNRGAAGAHRHPSHPSISETTSRPTPANPYYRLSEQYYGYSEAASAPRLTALPSGSQPDGQAFAPGKNFACKISPAGVSVIPLARSNNCRLMKSTRS